MKTYIGKFKRRAVGVLLAVIITSVVPFVGCSQSKYDYFVDFSLSSEFFVDGKKLSAGQIADLNSDISKLLHSIESSSDTERDGSDLRRIASAAAGERVTVNSYTAQMLKISDLLYAKTNGAFSAAMYNVSELWGFTPLFEGEYNRRRNSPSEEKLRAAGENSRWHDVSFGNDWVEKKNSEVRLDFGGIAKGYMSDAVRALLADEYRGKALNGILNVMSSNTVLFGNKKTGSAERGYSVKIENPRRLTTDVPEAAFLVGLSDVVLSTSADTYRFYVNEDRIYSHIIDPHTCAPSQNGVISTTVIVPLSVENAGAFSDALSTAAFCMPLTQTLSFFEEQSRIYGVGAVIVTADFRYYVVGDYSVLTRREYAQQIGAENANNVQDVFVREKIENASDIVLPCQEEKNYISYVGEFFG